MGAALGVYRTYTDDEAFICRVCPGVGRRELAMLRRTFRKVDADNSGRITPIEFLMHFDLERTPFSLKAFRVMDLDGDATIDNMEFALAVWNFLSLTKDGLCRFAFAVYDLDGSGEIECDEVRTMVRELYVTLPHFLWRWRLSTAFTRPARPAAASR